MGQQHFYGVTIFIQLNEFESQKQPKHLENFEKTIRELCERLEGVLES